ncbi:MAG: hypothetical protein AAF667_19950 [Pseudomonadota bacterium]
MPDPNMENFGKRLRRIDRKHKHLSRGFVTVVNSDGLLVAQPRRTPVRFPWKLVAVLLIALFAFKGLIYANHGADNYALRVSALKIGTPVEQIGGWVMQPDPLTIWIAGKLDGLL